MDLSNKNILHIKKENIEYIQFKRLLKYEDIIMHAYTIGLNRNYRTTRADGGVLTIEEMEFAKKNYSDLCKILDLNFNNIVKTNQTHSDNIKIINCKEKNNEPDFFSYKDIDGLITDKSDFILSTTNADCILLIMFDPVKKVIANVHSGWKGTIQRIGIKAINKMHEYYGCDLEDIICCICPSIRKCHFEVDEDVYEMFFNEFGDIKENFEDIIERRGNKWHIDTVLINKILLKRIGLKEENIIDSEICSVCNKKIVHSYRAEGKSYGLNTAIVTLK